MMSKLTLVFDFYPKGLKEWTNLHTNSHNPNKHVRVTD